MAPKYAQRRLGTNLTLDSPLNPFRARAIPCKVRVVAIWQPSTATTPDSNGHELPLARSVRWVSGQPSSAAAKFGRAQEAPIRGNGGAACDIERPTTVTHGQSWSLDGRGQEDAWQAFALVRALEASLKLVVRGRVELPTFRFQRGAKRGTFEDHHFDQSFVLKPSDVRRGEDQRSL
jgi:hypothetical protein